MSNNSKSVKLWFNTLLIVWTKNCSLLYTGMITEKKAI